MAVRSEPETHAMHHVRRGAGRPLLLVHGLGGTWRSWSPILDRLAAQREVISVDLPGFGATPPLAGRCTVPRLADALAGFVLQQNLRGVDAVGLSLGGWLVLSLARSTDVLGRVVALAPGGFRRGRRRHVFFFSMLVAITALRWLAPLLPRIARRPIGRSLLLGMLCARPESVLPQMAVEELRGMVSSASFDDLVFDLAYGDQTPHAARASNRPMCIGWGREDRICWPSQAGLALQQFPEAELHWFPQAGHLLHWDRPDEIARFILHAADSSASSPCGGHPTSVPNK